MESLVEELAGLVVWLLANWAYLGARRTGTRGLRRFVAFWMGLPGTLLSLFLVKEGSQPKLAPPPDDEDALLAEVRRSRGLPGAGGGASDTTTTPTEEDQP